MKEITSNQQLLDLHGKLQTTGYSRHMNFVLDKKHVRPLRLKEWDFYQIHFDSRYVLQLTLGHLSGVMHACATLIDLASGERHEISKVALVRRSFRRNMPTNPETAHTLQYFARNLHVQFETTDKFRRLSFTSNDYHGIKAEINLMLTNVSKAKEKLVTATPFGKQAQWYLNCKENCFTVNGYARIEDVAYQINNGIAFLDWGRGVFPYHCKWVWGNGGTNLNGKNFGFNIGWGTGNSEQMSQNAFFYDNKLYILSAVEETREGDGYRYRDADGRFDFFAEPILDTTTKKQMLWVNNKCHQIFGRWSGHVLLDDGTKLTVPPFVAFCRRIDNHW